MFTLSHPGEPTPDDLMRIYLRRHLAAAGAGTSLFRRVASNAHPSARDAVAQLAREVEEDQKALKQIARRYKARRPLFQEVLAGFGQDAGRLNPTGTLLQRSPLADVFELEALGTAVQGKLLGFRSLRALAGDDPRLDPEETDRLCQRAQDQQERIEVLRLEAVRRALAG